jgi:hypothetical protein
MSRTFLAGFRGADGLSLARALALLLVVAGCLGAVHSGRMAADAAGGMVICSANGAGIAGPGNPRLPATQDHCVCCALGCAAAASGVLIIAIARPAATPPETEVRGPVRTSLAVPARRSLNAGPRGPPVLA